MTKVGAYAILRVYSLMFGPGAGPVAGLIDPWLLPMALATVAFGTVGALSSRRLAELSAYLVVVSAGTLLTAFGLGGVAAVAAGLYYLAHTTFAAAAMFLLADVLGRARGELGDRLVAGPALANGNLVAGLFLVVAISVAGVPPLSGFVGKLLILQSSLDSPWAAWVLAVVLVTSLLTIVGLARSGSRLFYEVDAAAMTTNRPLRTGDLLAPATLAIAGVAMVAFAGPMYDFSRAAAEQLIAPTAYLTAVLPGGTAP